MRRGKVYLVAMDMPDNCTYGRRIFGALKCDWFAQDYGQPWNKYTTSTYMMCQGFVYAKDQVDPMKWRGLVNFDTIWRIETFLRKDFDIIR